MPAPTILYASTTASTIQAAWDSLQTRTPLTPVTIEVLAGTYAEGLTLANQPYAHMITIQGDTRTAAGGHFKTTGSITKSGSNCTITLVNTPPADFTSSDHIVIGAPTSPGNAGRFPIVSIDTVAKTVTYTNASGVAEAVRPNTEVIFCPDRIIDFAGFSAGVRCLSSAGSGVTVSGFTITSSSATPSQGLHVIGSATLNTSKCVTWNIPGVGYYAVNGGVLNANSSCTAVKCVYGFQSNMNGSVNAYNTYASDCSAAGYGGSLGGMTAAGGAISANSLSGFYCYAGLIYAGNATASDNTQGGFEVHYNGFMQVDGATSRNNGTGYLAQFHGVLLAASTNVNNSGNTTNYSPGTSGVDGNNGAMIVFS